ncbi:GNAT superfamily N-acetyltransferase [Cytobacillus horneckiae]|uniref:N-acetyltransferase n=1 Tax=Cytobacillus horneckiae TaxID=549687 RepID=A0A2N0Z8F5_9BACI|nr:GNAT family N-acetyltransferase [Cytobacillus horneckiae]MBN6886482.1 GNAT family N-acetyltransferase [Cytobacillus horneckiae]MCM3176722.1 GNAT family N-acetyltransferase [Cytobacillus horneckiae]MEC1158441.1 GNAT family N-acetyltransferase [Cytobacillus horneckiae]MED2939544.1 GNAT family N-acetyltransferase [Cytobacillus horneckiae]PKG25780.1 N-acetyltransferase [Cytobacillus horneckiae]
MEMKKLTQCTLAEITEAWNKGFEGYLMPATMDPHSLIKKMAGEELSADQSIVSFIEGKPIGIILTGMRQEAGRKVAWNGGTGVAPAYRGKGAAIKMMEALFEIYRKNNVSTATLEALEKNERAIALYKKLGYEVKDHLLFLSKKIKSDELFLQNNEWTIQTVLPEQLAHLDFYTSIIPWQCQWQSLKHGEAFVVKDQAENIAGYGLYRKVLNSAGKVEKVNIYDMNYQHEKIEGTDFTRQFLSYLVTDVGDTIEVSTFNFPAKNTIAAVLLEIGFEKKLGQVYMEKMMG